MTELALLWKPVETIPYTHYCRVDGIWVGRYDQPSDKSTWVSLTAAPGDDGIIHFPQTPKKFPDLSSAESWAISTLSLILKARQEPLVMNGNPNEGTGTPPPVETEQKPQPPFDPAKETTDAPPEPIIPPSDFVEDPGDINDSGSDFEDDAEDEDDLDDEDDEE